MSTNHTFPPPTPDQPAALPPEVGSPRSSSRRGLTVGLAAGLLGGTAVGLVFGVPGLTSAADAPATISAVAEQASEPTTEPATESTEPTTDSAEPAGPTDEADRPDRTAHLRERLQPLVDDGTITAEQADAVAAQLAESGPRLGDLREGRGPGGGFGGHGPGLFGRGAGVVSEAVTDLLGLDVDELRTQLREGSTLAEIATAQGIDPQTVIDELVGEVQERLDTAVENGRLDQAEADEKLADAETWITEAVNNGALPRHERPDAPDAPDAPESED